MTGNGSPRVSPPPDLSRLQTASQPARSAARPICQASPGLPGLPGRTVRLSALCGKDPGPPPRFCCRTTCNPSSPPWSPTVKVHSFQTAGHGIGCSFPGGVAGLSQLLGLPANGTTIHAMVTTLSMVHPSAVAFMEASRLFFPLTCASGVCGVMRVRKQAAGQRGRGNNSSSVNDDFGSSRAT